MARKEIIVRYFCLWCAMLASLLVSAQETDVWNTTYKRIEQSIRKPMFANQSYNIKDFGARVDANAAENHERLHDGDQRGHGKRDPGRGGNEAGGRDP